MFLARSCCSRLLCKGAIAIAEGREKRERGGESAGGWREGRERGRREGREADRQG